MTSEHTRVRIGIPADAVVVDEFSSQVVGDKYLDAISEAVHGVPLILPTQLAVGSSNSGAGAISASERLDDLDGLLLTGSASNIEPFHYDDAAEGVGPFDARRDANNLTLLQAALLRDMPVFAICRGFQELNVACGGTLYTAVHTVPGMMDHRADHTRPLDQCYGPAHDVSLTPDGWLAGLLGANEVAVNSLHGQGVNRVGKDLVVEARAPDGLPEALRHTGKHFVVAVQWHPEWHYWDNPVSLALFSAFADAAKTFRRNRLALELQRSA